MPPPRVTYHGEDSPPGGQQHSGEGDLPGVVPGRRASSPARLTCRDNSAYSLPLAGAEVPGGNGGLARQVLPQATSPGAPDKQIVAVW